MSFFQSRMIPSLHPNFPSLIGLAGPGGVGKDTTGTNLRNIIGEHRPARTEYLAKPLYEMASALSGVPIPKLQDRATKETPFSVWYQEVPDSMLNHSPRTLLQFLGKMMRDQFGGDVWVDLLRYRVKEFTSKGGVVIVTDVRYVNEAVMMDTVVELEREGVAYANNHESAMRLPAELIKHTHKIAEQSPACVAKAITEALSGLCVG